MQNKLYIGFPKKIETPSGGLLFIDDEVPEIPKARIFDPRFDSFNPFTRSTTGELERFPKSSTPSIRRARTR
jgi:hypothetical protein